MAENLGPYDITLEQALNRAINIIARDFPSDDQPDIDGLKSIVLKKGKNVTKVAKYWEIRSRNTGEHKYNNLNIITLRQTKARGWELEPEHSITIDDKAEDDSIAKLFGFLAALPQINTQGKFLVVSSEDVDGRLGQILEAISGSDQIVDVVSQILSWVNSDKNASYGLIKLASDDPLRSKSLVAALNYGRYYRALEEFKQLVEEDRVENVYQDFLEKHYWMFGSEYSELLPRRRLTRDIILDFPLRRTVDGYLEVIEIKRPMSDKLLYIGGRYLQMRSEVAPYMAQVRDQLSALDANKHMIQAEDGFIVDKVRAKLVVGRDHNDAEQLKALRSDNANNNRIEILTFDQLIRIAQRILDIMAKENPMLSEVELQPLKTDNESEPSDDIPF